MDKTLKNIDIINAISPLQELMGEKLPSKISWNLTKNYRKLTDCIKDFGDCEKKLIEQYAFKKEDGSIRLDENNQYKIIPKNVEVFNKERKDLLNCEDTVDIHMIKLSELDNIDVKATTLFNLDFMIDDEEN